MKIRFYHDRAQDRLARRNQPNATRSRFRPRHTIRGAGQQKETAMTASAVGHNRRTSTRLTDARPGRRGKRHRPAAVEALEERRLLAFAPSDDWMYTEALNLGSLPRSLAAAPSGVIYAAGSAWDANNM